MRMYGQKSNLIKCGIDYNVRESTGVVGWELSLGDRGFASS